MSVNTAWYRSSMPERCLEALLTHAKIRFRNHMVGYRVRATRNPRGRRLPGWRLGQFVGSNRKRLENRFTARLLSCTRFNTSEVTVLLGEVTSKMRLRFWSLGTAASDHGRASCQPARMFGTSRLR